MSITSVGAQIGSENASAQRPITRTTAMTDLGSAGMNRTELTHDVLPSRRGLLGGSSMRSSALTGPHKCACDKTPSETEY